MTTADHGASAFDLPARLRAKAAPELIAADERAFAAIRRALRDDVRETERRLISQRRAPGRSGQQAMERDLEIQRLSTRGRLLARFGLDICIGRMVTASGEHLYLGRFGLGGDDGARLLIDWRAPAAAPFFAASHTDPMGVSSRRRYRWSGGRIVDYWDEVFAPDGVDHSAALDDQSAFIVSLGASRSPRMRDVLATIQEDQDAIIRAGSRGALVVDGGPGTGKTVVALHRAAYLLYSDSRLQAGRGGLLFVGPHRPYIDYVDDVLPSLGEDGVLVVTPADLVEGGADARIETDADVRREKADGRLADAVDAAVRMWERVPRQRTMIGTPWGQVVVSAAEWREVFRDMDDALPHNEVRLEAWDRLLDLLVERVDTTLRGARPDPEGDSRWSEGWGEAAPAEDPLDPLASDGDFDAYGLEEDDGPTRAVLEADEDLRAGFDALWPLLDPDAVVRGLWRASELLRACAPWLTDAQIDILAASASESGGWTDADLPLVDAARLRVGAPDTEIRRRRARYAADADHEVMSAVVDQLIAVDDGDLHLMSMLRGQDLRSTLATPVGMPVDVLAGPFAHIVVDEAQELTDAQWAMLVRRCPSRSFTIVGDRAQAREGFAETWTERLERVGIPRSEIATLTVNYRTPQEVMDVAAPVIRAVLPDANVPTAIRRAHAPVRRGRRAELPAIVDGWLRAHDEGTAVVIGDASFAPTKRVRVLTPQLVKGLEFDLVVLVDADRFGEGIRGAVDRYVAMTRATGQLVLLAS